MHTLPGGPLEDDPYRGHDDVVAMQGFTAQLVSVDPFAANLHPGDIPHRFYSGLREHDLGELVRVWRRDGEIVAWAAVYPEQHVMDFLHHPKDREAADAAVEWAIQTYADQGGSGDLETEAAEGDASRQHLLSQHGFAESGNPYVVTRRPLSDQVPDISSPGYTVRAVTGLHEAAALPRCTITRFAGNGPKRATDVGCRHPTTNPSGSWWWRPPTDRWRRSA